MFVTFYSYKGGVGRTLALANIAYLLANDEKESCKILLWDFDLEAPGLQQMFSVKWGQKKQGFVDLVYKYMSDAKIPEVASYIHKTDVNNIDILPAGYVDKAYSEKLEKINWVTLYNKARGYDFIENLKAQIGEFKYDYILIDSRTGYSDVGNICVSQLPDLAILLFRLNNQNVEGTKKVYNIILNTNKAQNKDIAVLPVLSPVWPFVGNFEANRQIEKIQNFFKNLPLYEITFESALTAREKIICRDIKKMKARVRAIPKIYEDYIELTSAIRRSNPNDPLTIEKEAIAMRREGEYEESAKLLQTLVNLRPDNAPYWRRLLDTTILARNRSSDFINKFNNFLEDYTKNNPKNPFVFFTRAELRSLSSYSKDLESALQDYNKAVDLSPNNTEILIGRARFYEQKCKDYNKAINDLNNALKIKYDSISAYRLRGITYIDMKDYDQAIRDFLKVLELNPEDPIAHSHISRAYFLCGKFEEAKNSINKHLATRKADIYGRLLYSHIMAALDKKEESLEGMKNGVFSSTDRAEIFIVNFELDRALKYIDDMLGKKIISSRDVIILNFLKQCALILKHEKDEVSKDKFDELINKKKEKLADLGWSFEEFKVFLSRSFKNKLITTEQNTEIEKLIKSIAGDIQQPTM